MDLVFINQSLCSFYKYLWSLLYKVTFEETDTLFLGIQGVIKSLGYLMAMLA